jgi:hypothetical protein
MTKSFCKKLKFSKNTGEKVDFPRGNVNASTTQQ